MQQRNDNDNTFQSKATVSVGQVTVEELFEEFLILKRTMGDPLWARYEALMATRGRTDNEQVGARQPTSYHAVKLLPISDGVIQGTTTHSPSPPPSYREFKGHSVSTSLSPIRGVANPPSRVVSPSIYNMYPQSTTGNVFDAIEATHAQHIRKSENQKAHHSFPWSEHVIAPTIEVNIDLTPDANTHPKANSKKSEATTRESQQGEGVSRRYGPVMAKWLSNQSGASGQATSVPIHHPSSTSQILRGKEETVSNTRDVNTFQQPQRRTGSSSSSSDSSSTGADTPPRGCDIISSPRGLGYEDDDSSKNNTTVSEEERKATSLALSLLASQLAGGDPTRPLDMSGLGPLGIVSKVDEKHVDANTLKLDRASKGVDKGSDFDSKSGSLATQPKPRLAFSPTEDLALPTDKTSASCSSKHAIPSVATESPITLPNEDEAAQSGPSTASGLPPPPAAKVPPPPVNMSFPTQSQQIVTTLTEAPSPNGPPSPPIQPSVSQPHLLQSPLSATRGGPPSPKGLPPPPAKKLPPPPPVAKSSQPLPAKTTPLESVVATSLGPPAPKGMPPPPAKKAPPPPPNTKAVEAPSEFQQSPPPTKAAVPIVEDKSAEPSLPAPPSSLPPPPPAKKAPPPPPLMKAAVAMAESSLPQPSATSSSLGTSSTEAVPPKDYWQRQAQQALANGIWTAKHDPKTNRTYYVNKATRKSTWNLEKELYNESVHK